MSDAARADIRFALPRPVSRAVVLGKLSTWPESLRRAGVDVGEGGHPDLAVAPAQLARQAIATGASMVVLEGHSFHGLERKGFAVRRFLPLPRVEAPTLVIPLDETGAAHYALRRWRPGNTAVKRIRNRLAEAMLTTGAFAALRPLQAIATRGTLPETPFLVAAAGDAGVPADAGWFLTPGHGDALARGTFHLFRRGSREPDWIMKFARVPGYRDPFERDEQGLRLAAAAAPSVSKHAPRLLGRFEVAGFHSSVETAARGEQLSALVRRAPSAARAKIDEVAAWIVRMGVETAARPEALERERERIAREILPHWSRQGATPALVDLLPAVPAVLQHNDLGTWNIVTAEDGFTAVDWEWAKQHGMPLWDLLYFLVDALAQADGARSADERVHGAVALLRGEAPSSHVLFSWLRRAVTQAGIPPAAVGILATLCFLHHGRSHVSRAQALRTAGYGDELVPPVERIAPIWFGDPALGASWRAWE